MIRTLIIAVILLYGMVGYLHAMDRTALDACEAILTRLYDECKTEHTGSECNRAITTRLCKFTWNEDYGAFIDRRIEESAAIGMPHQFVSLTRVKPKYVVAGAK